MLRQTKWMGKEMTEDEITTMYFNMLSTEIRDKSTEHPGIPTVDIGAAVAIAHIAKLYAKIEMIEEKLK